MVVSGYPNLKKVYCEECFQRALHANSILDQCDMVNIASASDCLDQLHQEFDSMVGASRALNYKVLEKFSRSLASFSRFLRNKLPAPILPEHLELLRESITLWIDCGGKYQHCLSKKDDQAKVLTNKIEFLMKQK